MPVEFDIERLRAEGKFTASELKAEIERRFHAGVYHGPSCPGIAYILSPILGLYDGNSHTTTPINMPHYMFYAPGLSKDEVGAGPIMGQHPYLISPGPMGYIIVHAGVEEKARINAESQDLLKAGCAYRSSLCIRGITPGF